MSSAEGRELGRGARTPVLRSLAGVQLSGGWRPSGGFGFARGWECSAPWGGRPEDVAAGEAERRPCTSDLGGRLASGWSKAKPPQPRAAGGHGGKLMDPRLLMAFVSLKMSEAESAGER